MDQSCWKKPLVQTIREREEQAKKDICSLISLTGSDVVVTWLEDEAMDFSKEPDLGLEVDEPEKQVEKSEDIPVVRIAMEDLNMCGRVVRIAIEDMKQILERTCVITMKMLQQPLSENKSKPKKRGLFKDIRHVYDLPWRSTA